MSDLNSAPIGRGPGDNSVDLDEDDPVVCAVATGTARHPDFSCHQGQVGHRGRQIQLELRLGPAEVAGLADAQMDQPGQPVFHHHSTNSIFVIPGALLQGPGLLQQGLRKFRYSVPDFDPTGIRCLVVETRQQMRSDAVTNPAYHKSLEIGAYVANGPACCSPVGAYPVVVLTVGSAGCTETFSRPWIVLPGLILSRA